MLKNKLIFFYLNNSKILFNSLKISRKFFQIYLDQKLLILKKLHTGSNSYQKYFISAKLKGIVNYMIVSYNQYSKSEYKFSIQYRLYNINVK